jgi:putative transcriptional regulator
VSSARQQRPMLALMAALAAMLASALWLDAARPTAAQTPATVSLAGQFLVASPSMGDPRFDRTVILMVAHDRNGALGIVINRPIGERPIATLLQRLGEQDTSGVTGNVRVFSGGPVQPGVGFVIHSADYGRAQTLDIDGRVAVTSSREILRDIGTDKGPKQSLVAFGYAGWGPGQLEGELQQRSWVTAPVELKLIFDEDRDKLWDTVFALRTQDL